MIIEAMKMETHITASQNGTIVSILVEEGQQVKTGQLLLRTE
jgi:pyruvate carboxylase